jgi:hypothetical protein
MKIRDKHNCRAEKKYDDLVLPLYRSTAVASQDEQINIQLLCSFAYGFLGITYLDDGLRVNLKIKLINQGDITDELIRDQIPDLGTNSQRGQTDRGSCPLLPLEPRPLQLLSGSTGGGGQYWRWETAAGTTKITDSAAWGRGGGRGQSS